MLKFYFLGHDYEYEARNALRVFDLNIDYEVFYPDQAKDFSDTGLSLVSCLDESQLSAQASLYKDNVLLADFSLRGHDLVLEKYSLKKLKRPW